MQQTSTLLVPVLYRWCIDSAIHLIQKIEIVTVYGATALERTAPVEDKSEIFGLTQMTALVYSCLLSRRERCS